MAFGMSNKKQVQSKQATNQPTRQQPTNQPTYHPTNKKTNQRDVKFYKVRYRVFARKGPIASNSALRYIIGDEPLSEPMLTGFTDPYMRH